MIAILARRLGPLSAAACVISLLSGTVAASSPASAATSPSPGAARPLYVALGDSITFGYNLSPGAQVVPSDKAYPFLAGKALGYETVDNGIPGLTTNGLLRLVTTGQYNQQLRSASLVTIDIGSNDLLQIAGAYLSTQQAIPASAVQRLHGATVHFVPLEAQLIRAVRARTKARIVLLNLYDPLPPGLPLFAQSEQSIGAMNRVITREAAVFRLPVIDVYSLFNGRQLVDVRVLEHDVHPTAVGQARIAASLVSALQAPGHLAPLVPSRYATLYAPAALYAQSDLQGHTTVLAAGTTVRIVSAGYPRTVRVLTVSSRPPMAGYLPADVLHEVFTRYRQHVTFGTLREKLSLGGYSVSENGRPVPLATPVVVWRGQTYLPVTQLAQALGFRSVFEGSTVAITPAPLLPGAASGPASRSAAPRPATAMPSRAATETLQYRGIGLFVDNARVATPSQADEPFIWRGQVYVSLQVIARAFHLYAVTHAKMHTIALLNPYGPAS